MLLEKLHPDILFSSSTYTHHPSMYFLPTAPLESRADDIISSRHAGEEAGMGGFTALLETVWGGELFWKQRAMNEWHRMKRDDGKE